MSNKKILIAEDEEFIRDGLIDTLESENYEVTAAKDGLEAIEMFNNGSFNLIILDIMMPKKNGYDVCREIRASNQHVPVIMLTAKGEEIDKVVGLQLGADDYITKPFGVHELLARILAVLRRSGLLDKNVSPHNKVKFKQENFQFGDYTINCLEYRIAKGNNTVDLSSKELKLLQYFNNHPNEVLTRDCLLNAVWGIEYYGTTRTLDQHIAQLRKKIETNPNQPDLITTVHGIGYRYNK